MTKRQVIDEEYFFDVRAIISETDIDGNITFVNRGFRDVSGYSLPELMGTPHNIVRHPDMPKKIFEEMWDAIKNGSSWRGLIKNRRSDGRYYWLETEITPIYGNEGELKGYISSNKAPGPKDVSEAEEKYAVLKAEEMEQHV